MFVLVFVMVGVMAWATIPNTMIFQGVLTDTNSNPITTQRTVKFAIYDAQSGGSLKYSTEGPLTPDANGFFAREIRPVDRNGNPLLDFSQPYWMEVSVNGVPFPARQPLYTAPYAFRARVADSVAAGAGDTDWTESGGDVYRLTGGVGVGFTNNPDVPSGSLIVNGGIGAGTSDLGTTKLAVIGGDVGIGTLVPDGKVDILQSETRDWITLSTPVGLPGRPRRWHIHKSGTNNTIDFGYTSEQGTTYWSLFTLIRPDHETTNLIATFRNPNKTSTADGLRISLGRDDQPYESNDYIVFADGDNTTVGLISGTQSGNIAYRTSGADYAEYLEAEEDLQPSSLVGLNLATGKVRGWRSGDPCVGVVSTSPGFVGNTDFSGGSKKTALVALVGQVEINDANTVIANNVVKTIDGQQLGYKLANGKVLLNIK